MAGTSGGKGMLNADLGTLFRRRAKTGRPEEPSATPFVPTLPHVNLLPDSVRQAVALTKVRRATIWSLLIVLGIAGALWVLQAAAITQGQQALDDARTRNTMLQAQVTALAPIEQFVGQLKLQQGLVTTALAAQPQGSLPFTRLNEAAAGPGIVFNTVTIAYHGIPAPGTNPNPCPNPDPFGAQVTIGCITFSALADTREDVPAFLVALEQDPLFVGPFVSTSTVVEDATTKSTQVSFTGSAGLAPQALEVPLTEEQIQAIIAPPAPEPSASPTEGGE